VAEEHEELRREPAGFGFVESPFIDGNFVLVSPAARSSRSARPTAPRPGRARSSRGRRTTARSPSRRWGRSSSTW
jgi:hypothetical protein